MKTKIKVYGHCNWNVFADGVCLQKSVKEIGTYLYNLDMILNGRNVLKMLNEIIIRELDASSKLFNVLFLITDFVIPHISIFFLLECKYWSGSLEEELRKAFIKENQGIC